ncbi:MULTISPECIES: DUF262 domain-containing protein [unclassified Lentimonas]|uniref:DUF262 domain-containing protein n=1 Tax=unclassified Lentimonas TaxID=2630993 RepID=UPI001322E02E|nr:MULTISPECIES: DUF262 domain-containing protein [unclassified Lentimonas]CAA6689985.1 protein of unknown function DUF262 [Lentimonas sp. CC10]CAA6691061.1 protein of unknown function DUF262 [Lentimonas sp. CC19]CAA7069325.1 protein of unknown function DUF262 [Lentimonas sp. CC11]
MPENLKHPYADTKSVEELLGYKFFIPSYQRGYRWTVKQVEALLNDLKQFTADSATENPKIFYCLQPLVVKKHSEDSWEVVDGQQRLTTIYLIMKAQPKQVDAVVGDASFKLHFETRNETSEKFLKNIDTSLSDENIDYYYITKAFEKIQEWFEQLGRPEQLNLIQTLLNDNTTGKNVKFIWYELPDSEDPIQAFARLNIGKIPLTNSELIRALFLRSGNFEKNTEEIQKIRIAQEWDLIEKTLQASDFWYFIHNGKNIPPNRIEYLFNLMAAEEGFGGEINYDEEYRSFHYFNNLLKRKPEDSDEALRDRSKSTWRETKKLFMRLEEWFRDRRLYHLVGFLVHLNVTITELKKEAATRHKSDFDRYLRDRIFEELFNESINLAATDQELLAESEDQDTGKTILERIDDFIEQQQYGRNDGTLRSILLLFNVVTLLDDERSNLRFPFDSFKEENWDIEHIRSVDSEKPDRPDTQKAWLEGIKTCYGDIEEVDSMKSQIEAVLKSQPFDENGFNQIYDSILESFEETDSSEADNRIENLTLLDQNTNRSYKNAVFPVKRSRILALDRSGIFVPLCTRNIFLKCYSKKLDDMRKWKDTDKQDYRRELVSMLARFFDKNSNESPSND